MNPSELGDLSDGALAKLIADADRAQTDTDMLLRMAVNDAVFAHLVRVGDQQGIAFRKPGGGRGTLRRGAAAGDQIRQSHGGLCVDRFTIKRAEQRLNSCSWPGQSWW